jgi:hypothetical protein
VLGVADSRAGAMEQEKEGATGDPAEASSIQDNKDNEGSLADGLVSQPTSSSRVASTEVATHPAAKSSYERMTLLLPQSHDGRFTFTQRPAAMTSSATSKSFYEKSKERRMLAELRQMKQGREKQLEGPYLTSGEPSPMDQFGKEDLFASQARLLQVQRQLALMQHQQQTQENPPSLFGSRSNTAQPTVLRPSVNTSSSMQSRPALKLTPISATSSLPISVPAAEVVLRASPIPEAPAPPHFQPLADAKENDVDSTVRQAESISGSPEKTHIPPPVHGLNATQSTASSLEVTNLAFYYAHYLPAITQHMANLHANSSSQNPADTTPTGDQDAVEPPKTILDAKFSENGYTNALPNIRSSAFVASFYPQHFPNPIPFEIPSGIACPKCSFVVFTAQALLDHHEFSHVPNHRASRLQKMPLALAERNIRARKAILFNNLDIGDVVRIVHSEKVCFQCTFLFELDIHFLQLQDKCPTRVRPGLEDQLAVVVSNPVYPNTWRELKVRFESIYGFFVSPLIA